MNKIDEYRQAIQQQPDLTAYLLQESGLPGPRGNLELAHAFAEEAASPTGAITLSYIRSLLAYTPERAPTNDPGEFLAFCGVMALGRLAGEGQVLTGAIRPYASDPRWRLREAAATALQLTGDHDPALLVKSAMAWASGSLLEQRAALAALCEPRLLVHIDVLDAAFQVLDIATNSILKAKERKSDEFKTLRKGLAYGWSVAVAAFPGAKTRMERWMIETNPDVRWVMKENLKKNRLIRMDPDWVQQWQERLS